MRRRSERSYSSNQNPVPSVAASEDGGDPTANPEAPRPVKLELKSDYLVKTTSQLEQQGIKGCRIKVCSVLSAKGYDYGQMLLFVLYFLLVLVIVVIEERFLF